MNKANLEIVVEQAVGSDELNFNTQWYVDDKLVSSHKPGQSEVYSVNLEVEFPAKVKLVITGQPTHSKRVSIQQIKLCGMVLSQYHMEVLLNDKFHYNYPEIVEIKFDADDPLKWFIINNPEKEIEEFEYRAGTGGDNTLAIFYHYLNKDTLNKKL